MSTAELEDPKLLREIANLIDSVQCRGLPLALRAMTCGVAHRRRITEVLSAKEFEELVPRLASSWRAEEEKEDVTVDSMDSTSAASRPCLGSSQALQASTSGMTHFRSNSDVVSIKAEFEDTALPRESFDTVDAVDSASSVSRGCLVLPDALRAATMCGVTQRLSSCDVLSMTFEDLGLLREPSGVDVDVVCHSAESSSTVSWRPSLGLARALRATTGGVTQRFSSSDVLSMTEGEDLDWVTSLSPLVAARLPVGLGFLSRHNACKRKFVDQH